MTNERLYTLINDNLENILIRDIIGVDIIEGFEKTFIIKSSNRSMTFDIALANGSDVFEKLLNNQINN